MKVEIIGDASSLQRAFGAAEASTSRFGGAMGKLKLAAIAGGAAVAGAAVVVGKQSVEAAIHAQEANDKLSQAFKNQRSQLTAMSPAVLGLEANQRKLGFSNDETRLALTKLIQSGKSWQQAAGEMAVASDLARAKHVDLGTATTALIRLQTGQTRAAKEFGVVLAPVTAAVDKLKQSNIDLTTEAGKQELAQAKVQDKLATGAAYYDAITQKVKDQSTAFAGSAAGGMAQFHAQLSNIEERIGSAVLPRLQSLLDWVNAHWPEISAVVTTAGNAIGTVFSTIGSAIQPLIGFFREHGTVAKDLAIALASTAVAVKVVGTAMKIGQATAAAYAAVIAAGQVAVTALTAAEGEARSAQLALNAAQRANPLGLLLTAVAAVATGILLFSGRLSSNSTALAGATAAARSYTTALDAAKASTLSLTSSHLGVEQAELNLIRARNNLSTITKTNSTNSLAYRQASLDVKAALFGVTQAQDEERKSKEQNRAATAAASAATQTLKEKLTAAQAEMEKVKRVFGETTAHKIYVGVLRDITAGLGGTSTALGKAVASAGSFRAAVNAIPTYHRTDIVTVYSTQGAPAGRQHGGPVAAGRSYIVGERGPELFMPRLPGRIMSHVPSTAGHGSMAAMSSGTRGAGGGGITWTGNVIVQGSLLGASVPEVVETIRRELYRVKGRNGSLDF